MSNKTYGITPRSIVARIPVEQVLSVVLVLAAWQLFGSTVPEHVFPDIVELGEAIWLVFSGGAEYSPWNHILLTFARIFLTLLIAMPVGMIIGIGMGLNWSFEAFFSPYILLSLAFPSIVWAYLASIWFGLTTYLVPVFVGVLITAPYVVINTWEGTKDLNQELLEMAQSYEANRLLKWRYILIPHLRPYTFAMMRIVISVGWKIMLVAEIFGTQSGLGFVINEYFFRRQNEMIIAWTVPAMIGIFVFERVLKRIEERQFEWRPDVEADTDTQMAGA